MNLGNDLEEFCTIGCPNGFSFKFIMVIILNLLTIIR